MERVVSQFLSRYKEHPELIVVFYASWFRPSLAVRAAWEAKSAEGKQVVFVNVDEAVALVEELKLIRVPAVYTFTDGEITSKVV